MDIASSGATGRISGADCNCATLAIQTRPARCSYKYGPSVAIIGNASGYANAARVTARRTAFASCNDNIAGCSCRSAIACSEFYIASSTSVDSVAGGNKDNTTITVRARYTVGRTRSDYYVSSVPFVRWASAKHTSTTSIAKR